MKKIAHVITRMILGGAQENTLFTVEGLAEYGHHVDLITGPSLGPEGELKNLIESSEKFKTIMIPAMGRSINPFKDLVALWKLYRIFKEEKYDIVHTHSSKAGILGRLAAKLAKIPTIIHTVHGSPFHEFQSKFQYHLYRISEKIAAHWCQKMICVADAMKDQYLSAGVGKKSQYQTIRSGINLDQFKFSDKSRNFWRHQLSFSPEQIVIGIIARLFELKGHDDIIQIASEVVKRYPNIRFVFIGDGVLKDQFNLKIQNLNLQNHFVLMGLMSPEKIAEIYSMFDIVVHPSLREGLARVIPEAMAAKLPVISYDVGGAKEVIHHGKNGFLLKPRDLDGLLKSIETLAENPEMRQKMGQNGYHRVYPEFLKQNMVDQINKLYLELNS